MGGSQKSSGNKKAPEKRLLLELFDLGNTAKQRGCGGQERSKWIEGVGGTPTTQMNGRESKAHPGLQRKGLPPDCFKAV